MKITKKKNHVEEELTTKNDSFYYSQNSFDLIPIILRVLVYVCMFFFCVIVCLYTFVRVHSANDRESSV